ncbi:hypothetical protein [Bosea sp. (in: a-proteobacteria)]|uniref:hypothetical protein n=1 Tax=Bosea sp. (in: a-proteobacteria) TaxID=1871050 RepID=UPI002FCC7944
MSQPTPVGAIVSKTDAEIMPNYRASRTVSVFHPISAVHDRNGDPAAFSIGTDHRLWVCFRDPAEPTGWRQVSLGEGLPSEAKVTAFDTTQLSTGEYAIALALAPAGDQTSSVVYVSSWSGNDFCGTDWSAFAGNWTRRDPDIPLDAAAPGNGTKPVPGAVAKDILMGNQGSADKPAAIIVVVQEGGDANHYFVNGDTSSTLWSWAVYPLPENPDRILDIAFGHVSAGSGVFGTYVLYEIAGASKLYFVGAVAPVADQRPYTLHLDVDPAAKCLAALADPVAPHFSNLYVGGAAGVDFYAHQTQTLGKPVGGGAGVRIIEPDATSPIGQIALAQDADDISIWMRAPSSQTLWYSTGPQPDREDPGEWSAPIPLLQHVAYISALRQPKRQANQLLCALSNNQLSYQWQDPATTLWHSTDIPLQDAGAVEEFPSYTTTLHFEDEAQNVMVGMRVALTSSQWTYVTINGYVWELSPDAPVEVQTDGSGKLTIIAPTLTLGTPVYHVQPRPESGSGPGNLNPAATAIQRLSQIQTADDLLAQFPELSKKEAEFGAQTISTLTAYIAGLPADGSNMDGSQPASSPPDQIWGGDLSSGKLKIPANNPEALLLSAPQSVSGAMRKTEFSVIGTIEDIAGDVLHALESGLEAIGEFVFSVAKGVLRFAVKIAGRWFHFVVKSIAAALKLINWILHVLAIGLKKIIEWLGFIFDWGDIVETHKVFTNIAQQTMKKLQRELPTLQNRMDSAFDRILRSIDSLGEHPVLPPEYAAVSVNQVVKQTIAESANVKGINAALYSSGGSFSSYQVAYGGILNGPAPGFGTGPKAIEDFVDDTLIPTLKAVRDQIVTALAILTRDYEAGTLTLGEVVELLTKLLVETVVEALKTIADGLLEIVETLLALLDDILFGEIHIPLLTPLYELVAGGSKMSLVDGFSLLASIPATISYKVAAGKAPFADGSFGLDSANSFDEIIAILAGASPMARSMAMAPGQAKAKDDSSEVAKIYSWIGGLFSIAGGVLNLAAATGSAVTGEQLEVCDVVGMVGQALYIAGTIPVEQPDKIQKILAEFVYTVNVFELLMQVIVYRTPIPAKRAMLFAKGVDNIVFAFADLVAYVLSFANKIRSKNRDERDILIDTTALIQSILSVVSMGAGGVAMVVGDELLEVEAVAVGAAVGAQAGVVILGLTRVFLTIDHDVRYDLV